MVVPLSFDTNQSYASNQWLWKDVTERRYEEWRMGSEEREMENGKWRMGNRGWATGNEEQAMENGEREMGNGEWVMGNWKQ